MKLYKIGIFLCLVFLMQGCSVNPATGKQDFVLMSEGDELALGRHHSQQVMKQYRRYDNPELQQYIQAIGAKLANVSHRKGLFYRFTLLDSTDVNAFALPGGYIYITRGLLAYLNSEAELAAVLGHEIGHVTARHSVRQHSASTATSLLGSLVAAASGVQGAGQLANIVGTGFIRGYGREHELEADRLGVEYLARAGYSPAAMRGVITTLKNQEIFDKKQAREQGRPPRAYHGVFSTHPDNDKRLLEVINSASHLMINHQPQQGQDNAFLERLGGLTYGDSAIDGIVRGQVFYHEGMSFKIRFPNSWIIHNGRTSLVAEAPGGKAVLKMTVEDLNKKLTPKQFLSERLGVKDFIAEKVIWVGGYRGYSVEVLAKNQNKVRLAVIFAGKRAFLFMATTKIKNDFVRYDKDAFKSIQSFSKLTIKDKKAAKELSLYIRQKKRGDSFTRLAKISPISDYAEEKLRLLNAVFPQGELKQGDLIKIVR